ncbi:MAG: AAA family ATPase [Pseudomonadota bacterium]
MKHDAVTMTPDELYTRHFNLRERPFTLVPDPSFLFWTNQHKRAYSVLEFGLISRAPITLITGEIGSGKTTLLQNLLNRLDDDLTIGLISNSQGGRGELLQWVLNALTIDIKPSDNYVAMFQNLQQFVINEYAAGRRVVLIIDEAQNLSEESLEELRMLTNINSNKDELLQLILVGQPELNDIVRSPQMRQLAQRVAANFFLKGMDCETTAAYVAHRLKVAGGTGEEFTAAACAAVYSATAGIPRLVNQLSELALLYAWGSEENVVTDETVQQVLDDDVFFGRVERTEDVT